MKHVKRLLPGVLAALFVTGCGSGVAWTPTDTVSLAPKPAGYEMPVSASPAGRPHRSLGELRVSLELKPSYEQTSTYDRAVEEMRKEARKRGADAIVDLKTLDTQNNPARGQLTLVGTLVIFTTPEPAGRTDGR